MTDVKLGDEARDFAADLAALRADMARLADSVSRLAKSEASASAGTFESVVDSALESFADGAAGAKARFSHAGGDIEAAIERNPLAAVLIAMAAGLVIGLLSRGGK